MIILKLYYITRIAIYVYEFSSQGVDEYKVNTINTDMVSTANVIAAYAGGYECLDGNDQNS